VYRRARVIGLVIAGIGLAVMVGFASVAAMNIGEFQKAQMVRERNPNNAMYDLQFFIAATLAKPTMTAKPMPAITRPMTRALRYTSPSVGGALLALNGAVWLSLGRVVQRLEQAPPGRGGGSA